MAGIAKALLLLLILLHFNTRFCFKLNKKSERMDDIELKPLTSRNERRKMHYSLENMEGRSNISLAQEEFSGGEIQHNENKLNGLKEHLGETKLAAVSEKFHLLRKSSDAEKKQNLRSDRGVSQRDVLGSLNNNSETLTRNTFAFFEDLRETNKALRETNEGLRETNKIMKEMYENTSNTLMHVLGSMTKNISTALGMAINNTMAAYSLELRQEIKKISCQVSQPKSCLELRKNGYSESGVNFVCLGDHAIKVYCDQETDGGGWTVFQRRQDGSVDFYLGWEKYRNGFGDLHGEFWLGNDKLHRLLSVKSFYELRVDLGDFDSNTVHAKYSRFMVGPENDNYVLTAEGYSGDAGDSLAYHSGQQFSTKDRDNDGLSGSSCSRARKGAWWYNHCTNSNLNGVYSTDKQSKENKNVIWWHWKDWSPLKFSEMKFRELM